MRQQNWPKKQARDQGLVRAAKSFSKIAYSHCSQDHVKITLCIHIHTSLSHACAQSELFATQTYQVLGNQGKIELTVSDYLFKVLVTASRARPTDIFLCRGKALSLIQYWTC